jgi:ComF family protein
MPGVNTQHHKTTSKSPSGLFVSISWLQSIVDGVLDLVFPPRCAGCGRVDAEWCEYCQSELAKIPLTIQQRNFPGIITIAATGIHEAKLRDADVALKYSNTTSLNIPLSNRLIETLRILSWEVDLVIPIPMHKSRLAERGYNQAQLLAEPVAEALNLDFRPDAIIRQRATTSQVGLTSQEREENVSGAFLADETQLQDKSILLIDDVLTTGSTLAACASAALIAGARVVYGLTVTAAHP